MTTDFTYTVIPVGKPLEQRTFGAEHPNGKELIAALDQGGTELFERVRVLNGSKQADMIVDESGAITGLPFNNVATLLYMNAILKNKIEEFTPFTVQSAYSFIFDRGLDRSSEELIIITAADDLIRDGVRIYGNAILLDFPLE